LATSHHTLEPLTGLNRLSLHTQPGFQPATPRSYSTAARHRHPSIAGSLEPSISFTRPLHRRRLSNCQSACCADSKKPLKFRGEHHRFGPPHLAEYSAGIGTVSASSRMGCRASTGRFPPPLWMRADLSAHIQLCSGALTSTPSIASKSSAVKGGRLISQPAALTTCWRWCKPYMKPRYSSWRR